MIGGVTGLLVCQLIGELLARGLGLPVPGPVIGLILLFLALVMRSGDPPAPLDTAATTLLSNLGLLFVPAGVGVVLYLPLLAQYWAPIGLAIIFGTLGGIVVTGWLAAALPRQTGAG